jgi:hypothetical protein
MWARWLVMLLLTGTLAACGMTTSPQAAEHVPAATAHHTAGTRRRSEAGRRSSSSPSASQAKAPPIQPTVSTATTPPPTIAVVGTPAAGASVVLNLVNVPTGYVLVTLAMDEGANTVTTPLDTAQANAGSPVGVGFAVSPDGAVIHFAFDSAMAGGTGQFVLTFANSAGQQLVVKSAPFAVQGG